MRRKSRGDRGLPVDKSPGEAGHARRRRLDAADDLLLGWIESPRSLSLSERLQCQQREREWTEAVALRCVQEFRQHCQRPSERRSSSERPGQVRRDGVAQGGEQGKFVCCQRFAGAGAEYIGCECG